jgi:hypothetical protein
MNALHLQRFFVACALVSDLCCPGYNPRQVLPKDSNLARTAARNKIDAAKIAEVRAELAKSADKKGNSEPRAKASVKPNSFSFLQGRARERGIFFSMLRGSAATTPGCHFLCHHQDEFAVRFRSFT